LYFETDHSSRYLSHFIWPLTLGTVHMIWPFHLIFDLPGDCSFNNIQPFQSLIS
jgi:hypothetical protein